MTGRIFDTDGTVNVLLARPELGRKWCEAGLLNESVFSAAVFGNSSYWLLECEGTHALMPLEGGRSPDSKVEALAFAYAPARIPKSR